jgi:hypothetical protein
MSYILDNLGQLVTAGVLGAALGTLVTLFISHLLAKSRSKEDFQRGVRHKRGETQKVIFSHLGIFANGILNCWEEGTVCASFCKSGPQDSKVDYNKKIEFKDYEKLKQELVKLGVFQANVWHSLDKLPDQIEKINASIEGKNKSDLYIDCYHFSEMCKSLWGIVLSEYTSRGGNMNKLTFPMPWKYPEG